MLKSHLSIWRDDEEEEAKQSEEEPEPSVVVNADIPYYRQLKKSQVGVRMSLLGRTADGSGYTYLKANISDMRLTHIDVIKCFKHLQFLDVSSNLLELETLQVVSDLPCLILLQADKNKLNSAALKKMRFFQVLIMNYNEIEKVNDICQPQMSTIELGFNKIEKLEFDCRMPYMRCLDFRNNQITSITNLDFPILDSLYLAYNKITSLVGIEKLVNLRILHVRNNPIKLLDGFREDHTKLNYINLRNCKVTTLRQIKKLRVLKGIETLVIKGCPYMGGAGEEDADADAEDDTETRLDVLASLPRLKRLNKASVTPEERTEAKELMKQWLEEGEKDDEEIETEETRPEEDIGEDII